MNKTVTQVISILSSIWKTLKVFLGLVSSILITLAIALLVLYMWFARDLPDPAEIKSYKPPVMSSVYDNKGEIVGEFWEECRIYTPLSQIPRQVITAFLNSEDARFYQHKGIDMLSILRAIVVNLRAGGITQGGSTITQQITRAILLSRERTFARKIKEAILATRIERYLTKDQILELYLNQIFLGNRSYGVAAAARNYFHKNLSELNLAEITILAGLPTAPSSFSPLVDAHEAKKRQLTVLDRMIDQDSITKDEAKATSEQNLVIYFADTDKSFHWKPGRFFIEEVRRKVKERYGDEALYKQGLKIYSTLDKKAQVDANVALMYGLEQIDKRRGYRGPKQRLSSDEITAFINKSEDEIQSLTRGGKAIAWPPGSELPKLIPSFNIDRYYDAVVTNYSPENLTVKIGNNQITIPKSNFQWTRFAFREGDVIKIAIDEKNQWRVVQEPIIEGAEIVQEASTGKVLALVGGFSFDRSEFNRATQALRQPGSAFKPFVYSAALDKGYNFGTMILDEPVVYQVGIDQFWSPRNYGGKFKEFVSFNRALIHSMNVPTIKIVYDIGTNYLAAYSRKMGINTQIDKYLSMALGANAVYLSELVSAYSVFPNYGKYVPASYISQINDVWGNEIYKSESVMREIVTVQQENKTQDKKTEPETAKIDGINEKDLNMELFSQELRSIEKDNIVLTPLEMKILYGKSIPKNHVITPQTSYLMVNMLTDVCRIGTAGNVSVLGRPVAGKTGTTNNETDAWFIGFTPDIVTGVWIGFDELKKLGKGETGGRTAAPVFIKFAQSYLADKPAKEFKVPDGVKIGDIASMTGGSTPEGMKPGIDEQIEMTSEDKAGAFFEKDIENIDVEELNRSEDDEALIPQEPQGQLQNTPSEPEDHTPPQEQKQPSHPSDRSQRQRDPALHDDNREW